MVVKASSQTSWAGATSSPVMGRTLAIPPAWWTRGRPAAEFLPPSPAPRLPTLAGCCGAAGFAPWWLRPQPQREPQRRWRASLPR